MPSSDSLLRRSVAQSGPADNFASVTPNDSSNLPFKTAAIYVGGEGTLSVRNELTGQAVTFSGVPAGSFIPVETLRVFATNTTATNLVALG